MDDPDKVNRYNAMEYLSRYKQDAKAAIPKLFGIALKEKDEETRGAAESTLGDISPEWCYLLAKPICLP